MINRNDRLINKNITHEEMYYIAGILDGGSSFTIFNSKRDSRPSGSWNCAITITNCEMPLMDYLNKLLFLEDSAIVIVAAGNKLSRDIKRLKLEGRILDIILPSIKDIMVVKRKHAEIMYQFRQSILGEFGRRTLGESVIRYRDALSYEMKKLNESAPRSQMYSRKNGQE